MNSITPPSGHPTGPADLTPSPVSGLGAHTRSVHNVQHLLNSMSIREKIGQKIMLDFRYAGQDERSGAPLDMVAVNDTMRFSLGQQHIGGVILFANNLKTRDQITALTRDLDAIDPKNPVGLLIGTDNEGGTVFRLPRGEFSAFSGNMALGAAYAGSHSTELVSRQAAVMANELLSVGINTNFAPVLDVNSNQSNPVINVRAFSDDAAQVAKLSAAFVRGSRASASPMTGEGIVLCAKHFPGHGDTQTDSHFGLPLVSRSLQQARDIDLYPYKVAIEHGVAPEMIMTAHIQYPALDDSLVENRHGQQSYIPATLSRKIQHDLLRGTLGYQGVTITDALDMKAISDNFDATEVVKSVFKAGIDIALMPMSIHTPAHQPRLTALLDSLTAMVENGDISPDELDASVLRILQLKQRHNRIGQRSPPPIAAGAPATLSGRQVEQAVARQSVTLLQNRDALLPLTDKTTPVLILTPWQEQGQAMEAVFSLHGYRSLQKSKTGQLSWPALTALIDAARVLVIGSQTAGVTPAETDGVSTRPTGVGEDQTAAAIEYAHRRGKKVILVMMRSPFEIVRYQQQTDAVLATYAGYGTENGQQRGQSPAAAAEVIIGAVPPCGKLPVNIYHIDAAGNTTTLGYARGFGLSY